MEKAREHSVNSLVISSLAYQPWPWPHSLTANSISEPGRSDLHCLGKFQHGDKQSVAMLYRIRRKANGELLLVSHDFGETIFLRACFLFFFLIREEYLECQPKTISESGQNVFDPLMLLGFLPCLLACSAQRGSPCITFPVPNLAANGVPSFRERAPLIPR